MKNRAPRAAVDHAVNRAFNAARGGTVLGPSATAVPAGIKAPGETIAAVPGPEAQGRRATGRSGGIATATRAGLSRASRFRCRR